MLLQKYSIEISEMDDAVLWIRIRIKLKGRIRIRIQIRINAISWSRIRINMQMTSQNVWKLRLFEHFFKVLSLYSRACPGSGTAAKRKAASGSAGGGRGYELPIAVCGWLQQCAAGAQTTLRIYLQIEIYGLAARLRNRVRKGSVYSFSCRMSDVTNRKPKKISQIGFGIHNKTDSPSPLSSLKIVRTHSLLPYLVCESTTLILLPLRPRSTVPSSHHP